jgi:predicted dehydrogenase
MKTPTRRDILQWFGSAMALPVAARIAAGGVSKPPIKVGQIGVGHAHASKLAVYRKSPDYDVVGLAEPNEKLHSEAQGARAFKGVPWMTVEQLLAVPGLQAVLIETEMRHSLDFAETCIAAGKHIHLDKPAGTSLPQFQRLLDAAAKQKLMVQLGYMYRYNPAVLLLQRFLQQGWLGELFEVHGAIGKVFPAESRQKAGKYEGGVMFELGCHLIDLTVGLLGKPETVTPHRQRIATAGDGLYDNMLALLEYPKAIATIKSSAMEVEGNKRRHLVACGTEGTFHIQPLDTPAVRVALSKPRDKYVQGYQDIAFPKFQRYVADAADMARVIRGEKENDFPYEHELVVQSTVLKASNMPLS